MKYIPTITNAVLCCLLVFILAAFGLPGNHARAAAPATPAAPTATPTAETGCGTGRNIRTSGSAVVNVVPDRALVKLGVESNGITARAVQMANTIAMERIIKAIKGLGIEPKDIATDWYVINAVYDEHLSLYIKGYRIQNYLAVTVRDVGKVNDVIISAMEAGANEVVNVDLYTSELRKYRDQARSMAVRAAREKAQALATGAGTAIGCVEHIDENTFSSYNGWWYGYGRNQNLNTQNVVQNAAPGSGDGSALSEGGPVSLGQISVQATVDLTFSLK